VRERTGSGGPGASPHPGLTQWGFGGGHRGVAGAPFAGPLPRSERHGSGCRGWGGLVVLRFFCVFNFLFFSGGK